MSDYFNEREEKQMTGTPEGVPVLAPLAPAGLSHPVRESSTPSPGPEEAGEADQPDGPAFAEPFAERVGPPRGLILNTPSAFMSPCPAVSGGCGELPERPGQSATSNGHCAG